MTDDREASVARATIPMRYLAEIASRSAPSPRALRRALSSATLPSDALRHQRLRVSIVQFEGFYATLRHETGDEGFGYFARAVPPGAYVTLLRLLTSSTDVASCLDGATRFYRLFDRHAYFRVDVGRASARLELVTRDEDQARSAFFVHSMLLAPWRSASWLAGQPIVVEKLQLPRSVASLAREARYLFGRDPQFSRGTARMTFSSGVMRLPVARTASEVDAFARRALRHLLAAPPVATLIDQLRALLARYDPPGAPTLERAARHLGLSRASMARGLARCGTSFQRVKDDLRRDRVVELLSGTSLTIAEVAERVGYSDPSALSRAFRSWTGAYPGSLRRRASR